MREVSGSGHIFCPIHSVGDCHQCHLSRSIHRAGLGPVCPFAMANGAPFLIVPGAPIFFSMVPPRPARAPKRLWKNLGPQGPLIKSSGLRGPKRLRKRLQGPKKASDARKLRPFLKIFSGRAFLRRALDPPTKMGPSQGPKMASDAR